MSMVWNPFKRRRRSVANNANNANIAMLDEKASPTALASSSTTSPPFVPRRSSKRSKRRASAQAEMIVETPPAVTKRRQESPGKENRTPTAVRRTSVENITALPMSRRLDTSPHLRPADLEKPPIPYNFRPHSKSQTSVLRPEDMAARPQTLRSRASGTPSRRQSSKRPKADSVREEEIRAMSSPTFIRKGAGEGTLRRDSKKIRGLGMPGSKISLPPEESLYSAMSGVLEQRGWEVGLFDVFNPRPAVRLSGTPQYVASGTVPSTSYLAREAAGKDKEKRPTTRGSGRKRDTIGDRADDLDASDLRLLMDRDKKRRERRDKERQEKLDRKLRSRDGRNRADSDHKRREMEEKPSEGESKQPAEQRQRAQVSATPPGDGNQPLRNAKAAQEIELGGLNTGPSPAAPSSLPRDEEPVPVDMRSDAETPRFLGDAKRSDSPANPFADPEPEPTSFTLGNSVGRLPLSMEDNPSTESLVEDPILGTAAATRISRTQTPPLSPVRLGQTERGQSSLSQVQNADLQPSPFLAREDRRASDAKDKRAGAWATFFRRGGTNITRPGEDSRSPPSEATSFSNISRESMRNQPLPPHLADAQAQPATRRKSGGPARTQSKFREDLPEMPLSPPESPMPSPDVIEAAAAAAAARRGKRTARPIDLPGARAGTPDPAMIQRQDTPVSPGVRGHSLMSASLASVGSEGSWLGSGKRQSTQSVLSRGMGSLTKRRPEFTASYEELGIDTDAEYVQRTSARSAIREQDPRGMSSPTNAGASPDEESEYGESPDVPASADPLTVHESMRRKPTLVHRDSRLKSREGLLTESQPAAEEAGDSPISRDDIEFFDTPEPQLESAKSIDYGRGHARQVSAGSAKLLDIPASKRQSGDVSLASSTLSVSASRMSQL